MCIFPIGVASAVEGLFSTGSTPSCFTRKGRKLILPFLQSAHKRLENVGYGIFQKYGFDLFTKLYAGSINGTESHLSIFFF